MMSPPPPLTAEGAVLQLLEELEPDPEQWILLFELYQRFQELLGYRPVAAHQRVPPGFSERLRPHLQNKWGAAVVIGTARFESRTSRSCVRGCKWREEGVSIAGRDLAQ